MLLVLLSFVYVQPTRPNGWLVFLCWVMPGAAITIHAKRNCIKNLCTFRCATYLAACWIRLSLCKMQISCHLLVCSDPKVLICANTSCLQCLPMQHVPPPPHKGQRIGEAQNPGPEDMAAFNLAIVNPTAIRNKMQEFLHLKQKYNVHAIACAETSATQQVQGEVSAQLRKLKLCRIWSIPVELQRVKLCQEPSLRGKSEGTSFHSTVYARCSFVADKHTCKFATRLLHCIVKVSQRLYVQVFVIYGVTGSTAGHAQVTDETLRTAWELSQKTALPSLFVGDFNMDVRCFEEMQTLGFRALQDVYLNLKNTEMPFTCKNATTPDTAILHPLLAASVKNVTVDKSSLLDTHDPVIVNFEFPHSPILINKILFPKEWTQLIGTKSDLRKSSRCTATSQ